MDTWQRLAVQHPRIGKYSMSKIRLFLDEDIHANLSTILQKRGYDVIHAQELQRKGRTNFEQLEFAVSHERCLLCFNIKDFVLLHNQYVMQDKDFGLIVSKKMSINQTLKNTLILLVKTSAEKMKNQLMFLSAANAF